MLKTKFLLAMLILFFMMASYGNTRISLSMNRVPLRNVLEKMGKLAHLNLFLAPDVSGITTVTLINLEPDAALDFLLRYHGLVKNKVGKVWYVSHLNQLMKQKNLFLKWESLKEDLSPLNELMLHIQYANAKEIAQFIKDDHTSYLSKRGVIKVDERTNSIYLIDLPAKIIFIKKLIARLDIPIPQIMIEAKIISIDYDYEKELGLQFGYYNNKENNTDRSAIFSLSFPQPAFALNTRLKALEQSGIVKVLSNPKLYTMNRKEATIEAGEEMPYQEVSESGGTAVVFKKAVLSLRVKPQVLPLHRVMLDLKINQDRPEKRLINGMPTISTRQIQTAIRLQNGQTVVLGGIYETMSEKGLIKIPILSNIPILGELFKQHNTRENKRELLIFITPKIVA